MRNKKGQSMYNIVIFIVVLILIMFIGLGIAFGGAVIDWTADEIVPEISDLGIVGESTNLSEIADYTVTPLNTVVQSMNWMIGIIYFVMLLGSFFLAFMYRSSGNKMFVIFYIVLVLVLVLVSFFISNTYEDFYTSNDEIGSRLQDMGIASFLIIQSPLIMLVIALISGIIMFTPSDQEVYV